MKKGQSGVSLIALVITIIVVIILAAVAFGTSTRTITNANWSTFANAIGEVRTAFQERVTTVKGEEAAKGRTRTDAQVYNFVAKNAANASKRSDSGEYISGDLNMAWLSRAQANGITATKIEDDVLDGELNLRNRNKIKVNTPNRSGVEISYYVTRSGDVFVWPPYEYEGEYYVNADTTLTAAQKTAYEALTGKTGTDADESGDITFTGVTVVVNNSSATAPASGDLQTAITDKAYADLNAIPTVIWIDAHGSNSTSPVGLESTALYTNKPN